MTGPRTRRVALRRPEQCLPSYTNDMTSCRPVNTMRIPSVLGTAQIRVAVQALASITNTSDSKVLRHEETCTKGSHFTFSLIDTIPSKSQAALKKDGISVRFFQLSGPLRTPQGCGLLSLERQTQRGCPWTWHGKYPGGGGVEGSSLC